MPTCIREAGGCGYRHIAEPTRRVRAANTVGAALGLGFGALVWLVNVQIVARILYPWFLMAPRFLQLMMHAVFFGLPLGLMYAARERRVTHVRTPAPA